MLTLEPITKADVPRITELYSTYLTEGQSLADGTFAVWDRGEGLGIKAVDSGEIAGFFSLRKGLELTYPHPALERGVRAAANGQRLYTVDGMLVLPAYRGQGLASRLVDASLPALCARADLALIEIWIYPDGTSPGKIPQERLGEILSCRRVPMFYRDLSRYGMRCPLCGEHCVCGAYIELVKIRH
ncbi:MAG: GNAT family N-acetyltransferase [Clostridia bacterium]|nr:GNAT family N-acetyltransferase [Clostridia bacterium]